MSSARKAQPYRSQKATKRVLLGETLGRRGGSTGKGDCRSSCDTVRTRRAKPFLFATGLEQQSPHSPSEQIVAEDIAKKMIWKAKAKS